MSNEMEPTINVSSDSFDTDQTTEQKVISDEKNGGADEMRASIDGHKTRMCDPCLIDETENIACAFCVVCIEYLCQNCCREHKKYKATRNHKVLTENIPCEPNVFKHVRKMITCSVHNEAEFTHKCEDHNAFICVLCTAGAHRKCDKVIELQEALPSAIEGTSFEIRTKLKALKEKNDQRSVVQKSKIHDLRTEEKEVMENIEDAVSKSTSDLMELKSKLIGEANLFVEKQMKAIQEDEGISATINDECNLLLEVFEAIDQYDTQTEVNMVLTIIKEKLDRIENGNERHQERKDAHLFFKRNEQMSAQKLGTLDIKYDNSLAGAVDDYGDDTHADIECLQKGSSDSIKNLASVESRDDQPNTGLREEYNIKISDDFLDCSVLGCVILDGGQIAIIDDENRKIKVFDSSYKFIAGTLVWAPPADICVIDYNKVAIIYKTVKKIECFELENNTLQAYRVIPTKNENSRITSNRTLKQLALVYNTEYRLRGCIQIREFSGKVLQDISLDNFFTSHDRREFGICYVINDLVVVSKSVGVQCLGTIHNPVSLLTSNFTVDENTEVTRHVQSDKDGNIYICSTAQNKIYKISKSCPTPTVTMIQSPLCVAIDHDMNQMIVGCFRSDTMVVISQPTNV